MIRVVDTAMSMGETYCVKLASRKYSRYGLGDGWLLGDT